MRYETRDVRYEMWVRCGEWDVRQEMWDLRWETRDVRLKMGDKRCEFAAANEIGSE